MVIKIGGMKRINIAIITKGIINPDISKTTINHFKAEDPANTNNNHGKPDLKILIILELSITAFNQIQVIIQTQIS